MYCVCFFLAYRGIFSISDKIPVTRIVSEDVTMCSQESGKY